MIITQTPLRIGLLGGGTDLPGYYREHGGRVLNCAIDKYVYVIVKQRFDDDIYVNYSKKEIVSRVEDLEHELVREAMLMTGVTSGVEITTLADIPSARLRARVLLRGDGRLAARAVRLPRAAGLGRGTGRTGLHDRDRALREAHRQAGPVHRRLRRDPGHPVRPWRRGRGRGTRALAPAGAGPCSSRSCCSTPASPGARTRSWPSRTRTSRPPVRSSTCCATSPAFAVERLRSGDVDAVGPAMRESWEAKRKLASGVSNDQIDVAVTRALDAGASGAKLTGAGGGGFLLVICPPERQRAVRQMPDGLDMRELPVKLDRLGSRIVLNVMRDIWG